MRIQFNQTSQGYNFYNINNKVSIHNNKIDVYSYQYTKSLAGDLKPAYQVSFEKTKVSKCKNHDSEFLLRQYNILKDAYSGRWLIGQDEFKEIVQKLKKRETAQAAINLLQGYEDFMFNIEANIFDLLKNADHKNKRDFQDILKEYRDEALERLREKQINIIKSTDNIIAKMNPTTAELVRLIKDNALAKIEDNTFGRQPPLDMLKSVKATGQDALRLKLIYKKWYKLPNSMRDMDAFIVKYSRRSHQDIAERLISTAQATIEHTIPTSKNKDNDFLGNMLLVSAFYNNDRKSMPLDEYIELTEEVDIPKNLQLYINTFIEQINNKKSEFKNKGYYPEKIKRTILKETKGKVKLDTSALMLTRQQKKEIDAVKKLSEKYTVA